MNKYLDIQESMRQGFDLLPYDEQAKMIADLQIRIKHVPTSFFGGKGLMCPYDKRCKLLEQLDGDTVAYRQCQFHGCRYTLDGKYIPEAKKIE